MSFKFFLHSAKSRLNKRQQIIIAPI